MMTDRKKTVTRCVCSYKSFDEIKSIMTSRNMHTLAEVVEQGIAGDSCGMCRPYISNMIKTGEIAFAPGEIDTDYEEY